MKIRELLNQDRITFSIEVFPPKKESGFDTVRETCEQIAALKPDFISITYGAGGSTVGATVRLAEAIQNNTGVPVMPHLTCVSSTEADAARALEEYREKGISNVMALRGDIPEGGRSSHTFEHAEDLIRYIRSHTDLCIGGACYPEVHPESPSRAEDIRYLKQKAEAGCDFLTTQMFFDNSILYNFLFRIREAGISVPVIAGIMPITDARQLRRSIQLSGTQVPERFRDIVDHFGSRPDAMKQAGIIYASEQITDLIANGITHIHLYSMNKPEVAAGILNNISELIK